MKLAEIQARFQAALLTGDMSILGVIPDSPRVSRTTLFGVYQSAYIIRLTDVLEAEFEKLHTYMGDDAFEALAHSYIAAHPSQHRSARWVGIKLPVFLENDVAYRKAPILADIARLEVALNDAFDAADAPVLTMRDLTCVALEDWGRLVFAAHPSVRRLDLGTNAATIWNALANGETPPGASACSGDNPLIVWRKDTHVQYRPLGPEEAMVWRESSRGVPFASLCEMLAIYKEPETAPMRAATCLKNWIDAGLLTGAQLSPPGAA